MSRVRSSFSHRCFLEARLALWFDRIWYERWGGLFRQNLPEDGHDSILHSQLNTSPWRLGCNKCVVAVTWTSETQPLLHCLSVNIVLLGTAQTTAYITACEKVCVCKCWSRRSECQCVSERPFVFMHQLCALAVVVCSVRSVEHDCQSRTCVSCVSFVRRVSALSLWDKQC